MNLTDKANEATIAEAAEILGVPVERVYYLAKSGKCPSKVAFRTPPRVRNTPYRRRLYVVDLLDMEAALAAMGQTFRRTKQIIAAWEDCRRDARKASFRLGIKTGSVLRAVQRAVAAGLLAPKASPWRWADVA